MQKYKKLPNGHQRITRKIGVARTGKKSAFKPKQSACAYLPAKDITQAVLNHPNRLTCFKISNDESIEVDGICSAGDDKFEIYGEGRKFKISGETELHVYV